MGKLGSADAKAQVGGGTSVSYEEEPLIPGSGRQKGVDLKCQRIWPAGGFKTQDGVYQGDFQILFEVSKYAETTWGDIAF